MIYKILADIVVVVHFLWILFLVFGSLAGVKYRPVKSIHLAGLGFSIVSQIYGWGCPLTYLEVWLRKRQGASYGYGGSFISHYLEKIIYLEVPGAAIFALTGLLCAFTAWMYWGRRRRKGKW